MNYSSFHRLLFSSLSDPFLDVTSAVRLLSLFQSLNSEKRLQNVIDALKKRHYTCWKEHCRDWRKLSHPQHFPLAFRSSSIRSGYMRGRRSHDTPCSISASSFIGAVGSFDRVATDEDAEISSMLCALLPIFSLQIVHFMYIYTYIYIYIHTHCTSALCTDGIAWMNYIIKYRFQSKLLCWKNKTWSNSL